MSEDLKFVEALKSQWMATVDALVDPLMIVDHNFTIQKANLALATHAGTHVKEVIGQKCHKVFAGLENPCKGCTLATAHREQSTQKFELATKNKVFEVVSQPNDFGVVQVYRDRTQEVKLREQLIQSEKLNSLGLLAGGVAHEINNPLGGIMIFSQMLERELPKDSRSLDDVREIIAAAKRCKDIVDNLLKFARSQKIDSQELGAVNLLDTVNASVDFANVGRSKHDFEFRVDIDREVSVNAVQNKLIQVFLNIIQNAMHAMPDGGAIQISYRTESDYILVDIGDHGSGIEPEDLKHVFDPFYTTKEPGEGTGLGLSICYGIIQDFGGDIIVESAVGTGTCFTVKLKKC